MRSLSGVLCAGVLALSSVVRTQEPATSADTAAREIPVPPIATGMPSLPGVAQLPSRLTLLDFFFEHLRAKPITRSFDRFPTDEELDAAAAAAAGRADRNGAVLVVSRLIALSVTARTPR